MAMTKKMPVACFPYELQPSASCSVLFEPEPVLLRADDHVEPDVEMLSQLSYELEVAVHQSFELAVAAQPDVEMLSLRSYGLDDKMVDWSYGDEWSQGDKPNELDSS